MKHKIGRKCAAVLMILAMVMSVFTPIAGPAPAFAGTPDDPTVGVVTLKGDELYYTAAMYPEQGGANVVKAAFSDSNFSVPWNMPIYVAPGTTIDVYVTRTEIFLGMPGTVLYYRVIVHGAHISETAYLKSLATRPVVSTAGEGSIANPYIAEITVPYETERINVNEAEPTHVSAQGFFFPNNLFRDNDALTTGSYPLTGDETPFYVGIYTPATSEILYYIVNVKRALPGLSISKSSNVSRVTVGDNVVYTITVNNTGDAPATNALLTESQPGVWGTPMLNGSATTGTVSGNTITIPSIPAEGTLVITYTVTTTKAMIGTLENNVSVVSEEDDEGDDADDPDPPIVEPKMHTVTFDPRPGSFPDTGSTNPRAVQVEDGEPIGGGMPIDPVRPGYNFDGWYNGTDKVDENTVIDGDVNAVARWTQLLPGLNISKSSNVSRVTVGDNVIYTITVVNNGQGAATNALLTESQPGVWGTPMLNGSATTGTVSGSTITIPSIPSGGTLIITYTVTTTKAMIGVLENNVSVVSDEDEDGDDADDPDPPIVEPKEHTVKFDPGEGTFPDTGSSDPREVKVEDGEPIGDGMPPDPVRPGYDFDGWYDGEDIVDEDTIVEDDMDVVARWTKLLPNLAISKVSNVTKVTVGDNVIYTITLVNNGRGVATNSVITESLPGVWGTPMLNGSAITGTISGRTITIPSIPAGGILIITYTVTTTKEMIGTLNNTVSVVNDEDDGDEADDPDPPIVEAKEHTVTFDPRPGVFPDTGSNTPREIKVEDGEPIGDKMPIDPVRPGYDFDGWYDGTTKIDEDTVIDGDVDAVARWTRLLPGLNISKVSNVSRVTVGDNVVYTITLTNTGQGDAANALITESLPGVWGTPMLNGSATTGTISGYTITIPSIPAGGTLIITYTVTTTKEMIGTLNNTVTVVSDDDEDEADDPDPPIVEPKEHTVTFDPRPGTFPDTGSNTPREIKVEDGEPIGDKMPIDPVRPGYEFDGWYDDDTKIDEDTVIDGDVNAVARWKALPNLSISKSANVSQVEVGNNVVYTITLTNNGTAAATGIVITESLPGVWGTGSASNYSVNGNVLTLANLAAGGTFTITYTVTATANMLGTLANTVSVTSNEGDEDEYTDDDVTVIPKRVPNLTITKVADVREVQVGDNVVYTITLTNSGNAAATNIVITESLPGVWGAATLNGVATGYTNNGSSIAIPSLAPQGTFVVTFTVTTTENMLGPLVNTVTVVSDEDEDEFTDPDPPIVVLKQHTVTFDPGEGKFPDTNSSDPREVKVEDGKPIGDKMPPDPVRPGYEFDGWYDGDTEINNESVIEDDTEVVAVWRANTYTVKFNPNQGSGQMEDQEFVYDDPKPLSKNTFTRTGYTFNGWSTTQNGPLVYTDEQIVNMITADGAIVTLYARWTLNTPGGGNPPGGGGGGGGTTPIPDPRPPLILIEDHVAYIIGYPEGDVRPNRNISRAEVSTVFFRLLTDSVRTSNWTQSNSFTDVSAGMWHNNAISVMGRMDILRGYPDGTFKPNGQITRAELAAIASRFAVMMNMTGTGNTQFSDISGHWASAYILSAASIGWVNGYPDGTFRPNQPITRAEFMTLANRMLKRVPETASDLLTGMTTWSDNSDVSAWYYLAVQEATNSHIAQDKDKTVPGLQFKYEKWVEMAPNRDWSALE